MQVQRLQANNFRLLRAVDVELHPHLNFIFGDNAAGKTSLLETLYTASHGRPISGIYDQVRGPVDRGWRIRATGRQQSDRPRSEIEISFDGRRHFQKIDGEDRNRAELARLLPLAMLNPKSHALVEEGPAQRRRFLGLGHVPRGTSVYGCMATLQASVETAQRSA